MLSLLLATALHLKAVDGHAVSASYYPAVLGQGTSRSAAIVLAADPRRGGKAWEGVAEALSKAGVGALLLETRDLPAGRPITPAADDVAAGRLWLASRHEVNPEGIVLAGDGTGALAALAEAARSAREIAGLALVSALLDPMRLDDASAMDTYGAKPLFVAVSRGDKSAAKAALVLDAESGAEASAKKLFISPGTSAGPALLEGEGEGELVVWITRAMAPPGER